MKVEYYGTPEVIKKQHMIGVKVTDNEGKPHDYGYMSWPRFAKWKTEVYPVLKNTFNDNFSESTYIIPNKGLSREMDRIPQLQEDLYNAAKSGDFNILFSELDESKPVGWIPLAGDDGKALYNADGSRKFRPEFAHFNRDLYNLTSDLWRKSPEEYQALLKSGFNTKGQAFETDAQKEHEAAVDRIRDYMSKIFSDDAMTYAEREADIDAIKDLHPDLAKWLGENIDKHKFIKRDDGRVVIDLNTGKGSGRDMKHRKDTFSDRSSVVYDPVKIAKKRERDAEAVAKNEARQNAEYTEGIEDVAKESLERAKARGDIANVGYKSQSQGGGLAARSQGQLNQLRKMFVKNMFDEKFPDRVALLNELGVTPDSKDAILSFLKGPKGDSSTYGRFVDKYPDVNDRARAVLNLFKDQGKIDERQSAILSGLGKE